MSSRFPGAFLGGLTQGIRAEKKLSLTERGIQVQERGADLNERKFEASEKRAAQQQIKVLEAGIIDGIGKLSDAFDKGITETNQMQALKAAIAMQITALKQISPEASIRAQKLEERAKTLIKSFALKGRETAQAAGIRQNEAATAAGGITAAAGRASAAATAKGQLDVSRKREDRLAKAAKEKEGQPKTLPASLANSVRAETVTALGGQIDFKTGMIIGIDQKLLLRVNEITSTASELLLGGKANSPATAVQMAIRLSGISLSGGESGGVPAFTPKVPTK